ncbi:hypothetical protein ACFQ36_05490, partial [Arthrobacter sp. GCM10027362]|uniref:hypothetical protein n=1 Tax=Arthrobacter sp. GCM10027362 TaxID=3273379 RepID=UPI00363CB641
LRQYKPAFEPHENHQPRESTKPGAVPYPTHAEVILAGVAQEPIRLELTQELHFTHYQFENQVARHLDDFSTHLRDRQ